MTKPDEMPVASADYTRSESNVVARGATTEEKETTNQLRSARRWRRTSENEVHPEESGRRGRGGRLLIQSHRRERQSPVSRNASLHAPGRGGGPPLRFSRKQRYPLRRWPRELNQH
eukprot:8130337-Pyramimonas_sp.AAC.1